MVCGLLVLAGPIAVLSNSFNHTFTKNKLEEHKRVIAVRHRQNMLRLATNRGKQSLWQNIRMVVQSDAKVAFTVKSFKQFISYLFLKYDTDGSGYLDIEEVKNAMGTLGMNMANDSDLHALVHECERPAPQTFWDVCMMKEIKICVNLQFISQVDEILWKINRCTMYNEIHFRNMGWLRWLGGRMKC